MNKDNPISVPSEDPLVIANEKLMAAIAKDLESQKEKSIGELLKEAEEQETEEEAELTKDI